LFDQIKKDMLEGPYGTYGGEERYIQDFGGKPWEEEHTWKT